MNGVVMSPYSETCNVPELRKFVEVAFGECGADRIGVASFDPHNRRNTDWRVPGTIWFDSILYYQGSSFEHPAIIDRWFNVVLLESMPVCYKFAEAMEPHLTLHLLKSDNRHRVRVTGVGYTMLEDDYQILKAGGYTHIIHP
jgi:hypothetical protein